MNEENTKGINKQTLSITLIAFTVLLFAILIILVVFSNELSNTIKYSKVSRNQTTIENTMKEYMSERDYSGLIVYLNSNNIRFSYNSKLYTYNTVRYATESFVNVVMQMAQLTLDSKYVLYEYVPSTIADNIRGLYRSVKDAEGLELDEFQIEYLSHLVDDMNAVLKTYLKLSDEEVASLPTLSDSAIGVLIETKMEERIREK